MNHSGPGNFPISLPLNSRPGNDVKNPDNNQEPVLSAYGGGTFAKKTVIHSGTGLSGYLEKLASRARIFSWRLQNISAFCPRLFKNILFPPAGILTACRRFLAGGFMDNSLCNVFTGFPVSLRI